MENSPFSKLPAELRNEIYDLAASVPGGIAITFERVGAEEAQGYESPLRPRLAPLTLANDNPSPLALAATCKNVRAEALGSFYAVNNFSVLMPVLHCKLPGHDRIAAIRRWLDNIGRTNRSAIRSLQVDLGYWTDSSHSIRQHDGARTYRTITREIADRFWELEISKRDLRPEDRTWYAYCRSWFIGFGFDDLRADDQVLIAKYDHFDDSEGHSCYDKAMMLSGYQKSIDGTCICRVCTWHFVANTRVTIKGKAKHLSHADAGKG